MSAGKVIGYTALTAGAIYAVVKISGLYSAAAVATNAMVRVVGIKSLKVGLTGIIPTLKFILQLECTNPTGRRAEFETFAIQVKDTPNRVGGKLWAQIQYAGPVIMEGREQVKIIDIPASVNLGGAALSVLVGPGIETFLNFLGKKKAAKEATKTPIEGTADRFISLEEYEANQQINGLGANPDEVNLLANIKKAIPAKFYVIGNVRVNKLPLTINEEIQVKK